MFLIFILILITCVQGAQKDKNNSVKMFGPIQGIGAAKQKLKKMKTENIIAKEDGKKVFGPMRATVRKMQKTNNPHSKKEKRN